MSIRTEQLDEHTKGEAPAERSTSVSPHPAVDRKLGVMKLHPSTLAYLVKVAARPGMFMRDFDLTALELQLYGYETALEDVGAFGEYSRFNYSFNEYLRENFRLPCAQGWARALMREYGQGESTFMKFQALVNVAQSAAATE